MVLIGLLCLSGTLQANPVDDLLERIDSGASKKFKTELVKAGHAGTDFFELSQQEKR